MAMRRSVPARRGTVLPLFVVSLIALLGLIALAIDIGLVAVARTQCQDAADAAAMGGARLLNGLDADNNRPAAQTFATTVAADNKVLSNPIATAQVAVQTGVYRYNAGLQRFSADLSGSKSATEAWTAMRATIATSQPTYFGRVFGVNSFPVTATATAVHRPRDVAVVLDFSLSMRFSSETSYPRTGGPFQGTMNANPNYPQFGPWSIFPTASPGPMMASTPYVDPGFEAHAPSNLTAATNYGPPIVGDFLLSDNTTNAFIKGDGVSYVPTLTPVCTPTPASLTTQGASWPATAGDQFPLKAGKGSASSPADYAGTVNELVTGSNTKAPGAAQRLNWEKFGYDCSNFKTGTVKSSPATFKGLTMGPGYFGKTFYAWPPDPREPNKAAAGNRDASYCPANGFVPGDWRKRFLVKSGSSAAFPPNGSWNGNNGVNDNTQLWNSSGVWYSGAVNSNSGKYTVNYAAVLDWLKSGPQTLPPSLESGRVVYYKSIPSDVNYAAGSTADIDMDKRFWKEYIDYVIGCNNNDPARVLYGLNANNTNNGSTYGPGVSISGPPAAPNAGGSAPYNRPISMSYTDQPVHPAAQFWFGPLTMMAFIGDESRLWYSGTSHEAHCWHLKAGIQSAIQDVKNNHPNDQLALVYFSTLNNFGTARVQLGQNYSDMINSLFFPYSLVSGHQLGDTTKVVRPFTDSSNFPTPANGGGNAAPGEVPNSNGGTNADMGLRVAYNEFSSAAGFNGRRGASKLVIFETDGVAHDDSGSQDLAGSGPYNMYYPNVQQVNNYAVSTAVGTTAQNAAIATVNQICALDSASPPGYSTVKSPARVHCIAFGELFEPSAATPMCQTGLTFLLNMQAAGNTAAPSDTIQSCWGYPGDPVSGYTAGSQSFKVIVGDYNTRINRIRDSLQRIFQSGIQVSLIQ